MFGWPLRARLFSAIINEEQPMAARKRKEYGDYVVSDSKICGGDLTFKGTRMLVKDVL